MKPELELTKFQLAIARAPFDSRTFLQGPAGVGKTTAGAARLRQLLTAQIAGSSILVLAPQRTLQEPYLQASRSSELARGSVVETLTIGGLARRLCDLFWPLIAARAGFAHPERPPFFLTLESSQYYMSHIVRPLLDHGYFQSVTMDRNRLYSQILDSLNKSAAVGFPYTEIGARLDAAWVGETTQRRIYEEAQDCASRFRDYCLRHNLLDFSLQLEILWNYLWPDPIVRDYLQHSHRHLIYDNVEEDVPRAHDIVRQLLPDLDSALIIYDEDAGYRRFLGADVESALSLAELCDDRVSHRASMVMGDGVGRFAIALEAAVREPLSTSVPGQAPKNDNSPFPAELISARFYPEMLEHVAERVRAMTEESHVPPSEIVIIAPYLSDALRFAITSRLGARGIPFRTHRPSRSLSDEPATRALLVLAALAHPHWDRPPARFDVVRALMTLLDMDLVRAHLLVEIVLRRGFELSRFEDITPAMQDRITYAHGAKYSRLRDWLMEYRDSTPQPLDYFLQRIFGELLSQPGYGFHRSFDAARTAAHLIESIRKFRQAMEPTSVDRDHADFDIGREYMDLLVEGVLAAQYLESWRVPEENAVLVAPAHSFLVMNRPVMVQFWLDPGASGWFEHVDQPLTHTRVLSRDWPVGRKWTLAEEQRLNVDGMLRLVTGLLRRCRESVCVCVTTLGESGFEQRGHLLLALNKVMNDSLPAAS